MPTRGLRTLVGAAALGIAAATAISVPAVYFMVGYSNISSTLAFKAHLNAERLAKYIYSHDALWQFQHVRLAELIELPEVEGEKVQQHVFDNDNKLVLAEGTDLPSPTITKTAAIVVAGRTVGRVEIKSSLHELLDMTALAAAFSGLLGFGIFFAVRTFPLRVLDRTLGALEATKQSLRVRNERFDAALNNMSQGLCMLDSAKRVQVVNQRFCDMFGVPMEKIRFGMPMRELTNLAEELVESGADTGTYVRNRAENLSEKMSDETTVFTRADGHIFSVVHSPMTNGGWVVTFEDITERQKAEEKIHYLARHDPLTQLPNRTLYHEHLTASLSGLRRDEKLAMLYLDLDYFKNVNDMLGHPIGDLLLCEVAKRVRRELRDVDFVARLGGDEFTILQVDTGQPTAATALAARLIEVMAEPFELDGHQVPIGVSVGIAIAPDDGTNSENLLKAADLALYRAKTDGRGTYRFFEPEMDARMQARRVLEFDLRKALAAGEFELYYQPLVRLDTEAIIGYEALLRWHHPERGLVPPLDFIPLAEETKLIVPIGEWVLRQACAQAARWRDDLHVAVNLSPVQFRNRNLVNTVVSALSAAGLPPQRLELEITESVLLQENDATLSILHQLRDLGVSISMDDFGTGYSSLSYLRKFPFDKIKIDRSFITDMAEHKDSLAIVRAVTGLSNSLGIVTIAEGVETRDQAERLKKEGCTEVQGYLYGKPKPVGEFDKQREPKARAAKAVA